MKVFLDTNVLVAASATRGLCADLVLIILAEHELILGKSVLVELRRVLARKLRVGDEILAEFEALLRDEGLVVEAGRPLDVEIRDRSDLRVLAEAIAGEADVLVTGDSDLLEVADAVPIEILGPRAFWERLRIEGNK